MKTHHRTKWLKLQQQTIVPHWEGDNETELRHSQFIRGTLWPCLIMRTKAEHVGVTSGDLYIGRKTWWQEMLHRWWHDSEWEMQSLSDKKKSMIKMRMVNTEQGELSTNESNAHWFFIVFWSYKPVKFLFIIANDHLRWEDCKCKVGLVGTWTGWWGIRWGKNCMRACMYTSYWYACEINNCLCEGGSGRLSNEHCITCIIYGCFI